MMYVWTLLCSIFVCTCAQNITIITSWKDNKFQVLKHFWKNTGLSPLGDADTRRDYLLSQDEKINLAMVGSIPNKGIIHVRIHWILDLITVKNITSEEPVFDFQHLDELIERLHRYDLVPSFELMGNPSNYFHDFRTQSGEWSKLIMDVLTRYTDLYDVDYMYKWRFELLNEPDLKMYNTFNFTMPQYIEYLRASERVLGKLIGPAGLFRSNKAAHPLCWGLLSYCNLNPCKLKMVTFHRKGDGVGHKIVTHGLDLISTIQLSYPNLTHISFGNDEADIMTGWYKPTEWRSDVRYASLVLQVIIGHINEMHVKRNIPFEILSNDNAFLNYYPHYFTQRTLLARFQMNNTNPPHVQFFRKPVYTVMGLLSLVGSYLLDIRYTPGENGISYILTAEKYRINFLMTLTNNRVLDEEYKGNGSLFNLNIKIKLEDFDDPGVYAVYVMDNVNTNPYKIWKEAGSLDFPDSMLRRKMRLSEELKVFFFKTLKPHQKKISVSLPESLNPTIVAVNVCNMKYKTPGPVEDLHFIKINDDEVLLLWSDSHVESKCLMTYVVEFRRHEDSGFTKINGNHSIFLSYHFDGRTKDGKVGVTGEYRVAAVDYFGRYGSFSKTLQIM